MNRLMIAATAAVLVAGCSSEPAQPTQEETATSLEPGQYEAGWKVSELETVDKSTPATNLKVDSAGTTTACIGADGAIDPALFAEDGDTCTIANPYVRNGRLSMDLTCKRKGAGGEVRQSVSGTFTKDSLESEVSTTTYLTGSGDYAMVRNFTAKRIGECPPEAATPEKKV